MSGPKGPRSGPSRRGTGGPAKRTGPGGPAKRTGPTSRAARSGTGSPRTGRSGAGPSRSPQRPTRAPANKGLGGTQVEGRHAVLELLIAGRRKVREVWIATEMERNDLVDDIVELCAAQKVLLQRVPRRKLDQASATDASQGVLAHAAPLPEADLDDLVGGEGGPAFLVALDGVTDPGNLGAIVRTAECAGVTGVVLPRHRAVHITPTVTKAAAGAVEHVPMAVVGGLPATLERLRKRGVWIVGLDASGDETIHRLRLASEPVCLVLGAEGQGLSRLVRQRCDSVVSIPLRGRLSSLNVATAAALGIYEVVRRRELR